MRGVTIIYVIFIILCVCSLAAVVFDTKKKKVCQIEIVAEWHGIPRCDKRRGDESCSYEPPDGWAIKNYKPNITLNRNGDYKVTKTNTTNNKIVPYDLAISVFQTLKGSGILGEENLESLAPLMHEYAALRTIVVPENGALSLEVQGSAKAYGECYDQRSGKITGHVEVEEVYVGKNYTDVINWILLRNKAIGPHIENLACDSTICKFVRPPKEP